MPKWLLSYLLVFLIPMAAGLLVYTSAERIIREDIKNVSGYVLAQIQLSFDNITSEVYALSRQIALDTEINALMEKETLTPEDRLLVMDAVSKCAAYKASATSVDDYYIYLKNSGCMLKYSGFIERDGVRDVIPNTEKIRRGDLERHCPRREEQPDYPLCLYRFRRRIEGGCELCHSHPPVCG